MKIRTNLDLQGNKAKAISISSDSQFDDLDLDALLAEYQKPDYRYQSRQQPNQQNSQQDRGYQNYLKIKELLAKHGVDVNAISDSAMSGHIADAVADRVKYNIRRSVNTNGSAFGIEDTVKNIVCKETLINESVTSDNIKGKRPTLDVLKEYSQEYNGFYGEFLKDIDKFIQNYLKNTNKISADSIKSSLYMYLIKEFLPKYWFIITKYIVGLAIALVRNLRKPTIVT